MASLTTAVLQLERPAKVLQEARVPRRRISPRAGHALEILGHAIEYLTDEYIHNVGAPAGAPQLQAIQLLMSVNRQIYFECPEVPTLKDRCRALLHPRAA